MALLFTALLGGATAILVYVVASLNETRLIREMEVAIDADIVVFQEGYEVVGPQGLSALVARRSLNRHGRLYGLLSPAGEVVSGNLREVPAQIERLSEGILTFAHEHRRVAAKVYTFANEQRLLIGADVEDVLTFYGRLRWLGLLTIVLMAMVVSVSFLISLFVVRRTTLVATTAEEIIRTGDLSRRIEVGSQWDDLSHMTHVLNALLDKIEHLMRGIRDVSDNIAHDLRTPLTRLRQRLEILNDAQMLAEADHLLATFAALLRISRLEAGQQEKAFVPVAIEQLIHDVHEWYEPLAEEKGLTLETRIQASPSWLGDRDLLFQMVVNMVDNAIKFTPPGGRVCIQLLPDTSGSKISVVDTGPGVKDDEKDRLMERFFRTESSRHTQGSGLGLSLVSAIASLHKATVHIENKTPGLEVCVRFHQNLTKP